VSRETLKNFLRDSGSGATQISFTIADQNGSGAFDTGDDLGTDPNTLRPLLGLDTPGGGITGDYVRYITENFGNFFPLEAGNKSAPSAIRRNSLEPAQSAGAQRVFAPTDGTGATLGSYSNSGKFDDTSTQLDEIVNKLSAESGNTLLPDVKGDDLDTTGQVRINTSPEKIGKPVGPANQVLRNFNRFDPSTLGSQQGRVFADRGSSPGDVDASAFSSQQRLFGEFDKDSDDVTLDQLKDIAGSLLLKSAGWDIGDNSSVSSDPSSLPDIGLNPEVADRFVRTYRLEADRAYGAPETDGTPWRSGRSDVISTDPSAKNSKSYGSTTTPDSPFSSSDSNVVLAQASAAIALIIKRIDAALPELVKSITQEPSPKGTETSAMGNGPYQLGQSTNVSPFARFEIVRRFTLVATINPYRKCVEAGLQVMFNNKKSALDIAKSTSMYESPGFWLAIARSVLRSVSIISQTLTEGGANVNDVVDNNKALKVLDAVRRSKIVAFMNVAATTGDVLLQVTGGSSDISLIRTSKRRYDVDSLPESPATRISKSRGTTGTSTLSLAWRNNSVPSLFVLSRDSIRASSKMLSIVNGASPARAMLASTLFEKTYLDLRIDAVVPTVSGDKLTSLKRIPQQVVKIVEDRLDSEYVPFYFHDLRTNEIIGFHAFLESLSDSITPSFQPTTGFGRIEAVQTYKSTSRSLGLSFRIVATSKEDFDEMWFKINKLATLAYPQWSAGSTVTKKTGEGTVDQFTQPFSQLVASSPVIRLRVGDVIKSNYSRFNLSRIFGMGSNVELKSAAEDSLFGGGLSTLLDGASNVFETAFYIAFGSPLQFIAGNSDNLSVAATSFASNFLVNGFANPVGYKLLRSVLVDPDNTLSYSDGGPFFLDVAEDFLAGTAPFAFVNQKLTGLRFGTICYLKVNPNKDYIDSDGNRYSIIRPVRGIITGHPEEPVIQQQDKSEAYTDPTYKGFNRQNKKATKTFFTMRCLEPGPMFSKQFKITHSDVVADPRIMWGLAAALFSPDNALAETLNSVAQNLAAQAGVDLSPDLGSLFGSREVTFMDPEENPFTRSMESAGGRGLAGVITSMQFNWVGTDVGNWETDWGSRAPMSCKVTINFSVIHDISPGLDASGMNRAPLYNVGEVMNSFSGDQYPDNGLMSKERFLSSARTSINRNRGR